VGDEREWQTGRSRDRLAEEELDLLAVLVRVDVRCDLLVVDPRGLVGRRDLEEEVRPQPLDLDELEVRRLTLQLRVQLRVLGPRAGEVPAEPERLDQTPMALSPRIPAALRQG
jgi:hypothetical protein